MAKCYASKVIEILEAEVGYLEKKSNSQLDSKTANAGKKNFTKYARDLDNIKDFYNGKKQGYGWCDMLIDWGFVKAYGVEDAKRLLCQPDKSCGAGCEFSMQYYKDKGQFHATPAVGDQIFFRKGAHTGIVYDFDDTYVYTIEGNTSSASGVVENGGAVRKKKYKLTSSSIDGYGRPAYDKELLEVDGKWGKATTKASQRVFGTKADGIVSRQNENNKKYVPNVNTSSWEFKPRLLALRGSAFIKALQKQLKDLGYYKSSIDGWCGKGTVTAMQEFLADRTYYKGKIDGIMGEKTVKAWQEYINDRM